MADIALAVISFTAVVMAGIILICILEKRKP